MDRESGDPVEAQRVIESGTRPPPAGFEEIEPRLNENSDWDERDWIAPPGTRLRVIVYRRGYALSDTTYTTGMTCGEQICRVALTPVRTSASLRILCTDPDGRIMEDVPLEFHYLGPDGVEAARLFPVLEELDGQQETSGFPPCRLRIKNAELHDTRQWAAWRFVLPASTTIDVRSAGVVCPRLAFMRGGACALRFSGVAANSQYFLDYVLRDAHGKQVPMAWYLSCEENATFAHDVLVTGGEAIGTALSPGHYELTLSQPFTCYELTRITVPIEIETGELTRKTARLIDESKRAR